MFKKIMVFVLVFFAFLVRSQSIQPTDLIEQKAVIVIPGISKPQLENLKTEFEKYKQIKQAVFVFKDHNCLLVEISNNADIKFYTDLMKIIQIGTSITSEQMFLKTPLAYNEIMGKGNDGTYFILK